MTNDWELDHIGITVRNIEAALKHYEKIGFSLFSKPAKQELFDSKTCFVQNESMRVMFIEPMEGTGIFSEYLNTFGEGANLMAFKVNDLEAEKARLTKQGVQVLANRKVEDGRESEILFDTRESGNVLFVLFNELASFPVFKPAEGKWNLHHLGYVVKDVDKFAEYYQSIGFKSIAPVRVVEPGKFKNTVWAMDGKAPDKDIKSRQVGPIQNKQGTFLLEVTEPVSGKDIPANFMEKHGEGIMHAHFLVEDLETEYNRMLDKGFPAVMAVRRPDGALFESFYDTTGIGFFYIALWSGRPPFKAKPE